MIDGTFFQYGGEIADVIAPPDPVIVPTTVEVGEGYARIYGEGSSFQLIEVINLSFDSKQALILEQPHYYNDSAIMDAIRTAQALPMSTLLTAIMDIFRQAFIPLATYMLSAHEKMLDTGDQKHSGLSLVERRNMVLIRYVEAFLPMNILGMKRLVEFFVTSATVTHNPPLYTFDVQIVEPKGVPKNLAALEAAIERAKPAHLDYTIIFTFTEWNVMDGYSRTWNASEIYTWDAFEVS